MIVSFSHRQRYKLTIRPKHRYLIYTSGSTGKPKAVVGRESSLLAYFGAVAADPAADRSPAGPAGPAALAPHPALRRRRGDRVLLCSAATWDPSIGDVFGTT